MIDEKIKQRYNSKSVPQLVQIAQRYFNAYTRKRDSSNGFFKCISCQEDKPISKMHAGHYFSVGNHGSVRFDVDNCHGQCQKCNTFLHGNLIPYRENLIKKIGQERFDQLEMMSKLKNFKYDRFVLIDIIERFKKY